MYQLEDLPRILDETVDVDSHENSPIQLWGENFGEEVAELLRPIYGAKAFHAGESCLDQPGFIADDAEINDDSVWSHKGAGAPGASDMRRRMAVMDHQRIRRSLVFPTFAVLGTMLYTAPRDTARYFEYSPDDFDAVKIGRKVLDTYNEWVVRKTREVGADRVRLVGVILQDSVDSMIAELEALLSEGVKAVWIPSAVPPGGTSPADPALDPLWAMAAAADVPVCLHLNGQVGFLASDQWTRNVPAFNGRVSPELVMTAYGGANLHLPTEHFLSCVVLGGVFERHPTLRFGAIETGGYWLGPLAERLDIWAKFFAKQLTDTLSQLPSAYIARNVRVTPFYFEEVDTYFDKYPQLQDCFCYSTDYPHTEGGKYSKWLAYSKMKRHGEDLVTKYFVENGKWLLPSNADTTSVDVSAGGPS